MGYPAAVYMDTPGHIARWRPFAQEFLALPHFMILSVIWVASLAVTTAAWAAILATGRLPSRIAGFQTMFIRYTARVWAYAALLTDQYPPFAFTASASEPDDMATSVNLSPALQGRRRLKVLFRFVVPISVILNVWPFINGEMPQITMIMIWGVASAFAIMLIPSFLHAHVIVIIQVACVAAGLLAVAFTGRWPTKLRGFAVGAIRVYVRFLAYTLLLTDERPPLSTA